MDFFKSVFSADPEPSTHPRDDEDTDQADDEAGPTAADPTPSAPGAAAAWNFGGLIKTIATKSESVIQTYRRDLEEFGSGLKKETAAIRDVAARAVLDLPGSLEAGASVAQESLESVGQAIDDIGGTVWRGTAEIISQGKVVLLSADSDASLSDPGDPAAVSSSKRYSRFDAQVLAIQSDPASFSEEPEDAEDYRKWRLGFDLVAKEDEIEILCYENSTLEGLFEKLVPGTVDFDTFWSRYYYRVYKLKQAEDARASLVKRVISREEEEEELTWEVDDEEEEEEEEEGVKKEMITNEVAEEKEQDKEIVGTSEPAKETEASEKSEVEIVESEVEIVEDVPTMPDEEDPDVVGNMGSSPAKEEDDEPNDGDLSSKTDNKMLTEAKMDPAESSKDSDFSMISSHPSMPEEDDLGWDEIEDLGENDDKKMIVSGGSPNRVDLRKRLSAAEDDEDLSWDIEEDDDPAKP